MSEAIGFCQSPPRTNIQRLCLPSSLSCVEPIPDDAVPSEEPEVEALVIPLVISSAALALFDASLVISFTLSLAMSISTIYDTEELSLLYEDMADLNGKKHIHVL